MKVENTRKMVYSSLRKNGKSGKKIQWYNRDRHVPLLMSKEN